MRNDIDKAVFSYTTSSVNSELEEENRILKETVEQLRNEVESYRAPALLVAEVAEVVTNGKKRQATIKVPNGNQFFVNVSSEASPISAGDTVLVEQKNLTVIDRVKSTKKFAVEQFVILEKPTVHWSDVGGLDEQAEELREVIELPLKKPELFKKVGITPPKGILLYGPPGTGKTLLAKAVAASTNSTFIEIVGSELVQKFIGEGAKLVKEIFQLAREKAPSIVFIDEIDALASKRIDMGTSGEREVQRTFMQLLAEIDGFKNLGNVKIIGCTNRRDILDEAIIRPGRLDRLIEVPNPTIDGLREIFKIHTRTMRLTKRLNIDLILRRMEGYSGAEVKAVCTEAGYFAIRAGRTTVREKDFLKAIEKVKRAEAHGGRDYLKMFG
ncbi:AAA family ATPase [Candidatus Woesearchaeota archaeon]|nr:MAG: AAA family ATPase [Candidatus Woesearchaeota archaeon]